MWKKSYCNLLKQAISLYNINSVEFADEIGVSEATIRQWQTGRNFPSKATQDRLYTALEATVSNLTSPSLSAQMAKYISKSIPSAVDLVALEKNNPGELVVSTLKMCYANGKVGGNQSPPFANNYVSADRTQVVVFDFDGTLTEGHATKTTWESIWIELGYDVEMCRTLHRRFDAKEITHEEWCRLTTEKFLEKRLHVSTMYKIASAIHLIDGCQEVFEWLKARNIKIHIVSGSILFIIQHVLRELAMYVDSTKANDFKFSPNGFFNAIIGTKYDFEGKADFVREIAENLEISTADILFVGNSYNDKFVFASGARTLCINPKHTDPSDRVIWNDCIQECTNLTQILPFVES